MAGSAQRRSTSATNRSRFGRSRFWQGSSSTRSGGRFTTARARIDVVDAIYRKAVAYTTPLAERWAAQVAGEKTIYVMGSGPAYGSAYIFSICNIEEMLQIDSPVPRRTPKRRTSFA